MRGLLGICFGLFCVGAASAQLTQHWSMTFSLTNAVQASVSGVAVDTNDNIYLIGYVTDEVGERLYLAKLNASGALQWERRFDPSPAVIDYISDFTVHADGTAYATGSAYDTFGSWLHMFASDGSALGDRKWADFAVSTIRADHGGDLYLSGFKAAPEEGASDWKVLGHTVRKTSGSGDLRWERTTSVDDAGDSYGQRLALGGSNNVFTARVVNGELLVTKFDADGARLWQSRYSGAHVTPNTPLIEADAAGNTFVVVDGDEPVLVKFNVSGAEEWSTPSYMATFEGALLPHLSGVLFGSETLRHSSDGSSRVVGDVGHGHCNNYWYPAPLRRAGNGDLLYAETEWGYFDGTGTNLAPRSTLKRLGTVGVPPVPAVEMLTRSQTVSEGTNVTLVANASGSGTVSYQWFHDGPLSLLEGATNATLTISNVGHANAGAYWVQVRDANGEATSRHVVIDSFVAPMNLAAALGEALTFRASAFRTTAQHVQWFHNGAAIPGATNESLQISNATVAAAGVYRVRYRGAFGDKFEAEARLDVNDQVRQEWQHFSGWGSYFTDMEIDPSGNLLVLGWSDSIWAHVFEPGGYLETRTIPHGDLPGGLAVDESGNAYVTANVRYGSTVDTLKFAPRFGALLSRQSQPFNVYRAGGSPRVAADGTAYVAVQGRRYSATSRQFASFFKVRETNATFFPTSNSSVHDETIISVQLGQSNDVFVLTRRYSYTVTETLSRFDREGALLWHFGNLHTNGYFSTMAVDAQGNLVLGGSVSSAALLLKRDKSGHVIWRRRLPRLPWIAALRIDSNGDIVATGSGATAKYNAAGELLWVTGQGGSQLELDAANNVYVLGGTSYGYSEPEPITVSAISPAGTRLWRKPFQSPHGLHRAPLALRVSPSGEVYVAAGVQPQSYEGFTIAKYVAGSGANSPTAPVLPRTAVLLAGGTFTLQAPASPDSTFQWFFNGVALTNETNAVLTIGNFNTNHVGGYSVDVRNPFGSVLTSETWATLPVALTALNTSPTAWRFDADARFRYELQRSSNLQHWVTAEIFDGSNGPVSFVATTNGPQQFFRVRAQR